MKSIINRGDTVAFLGVGHMGCPMANAIAKAGYRVVGWSRSPKTFDTMPAFEFTTDIDHAVKEAGVVITCLRDQHVVEDVLFGTGLAQSLSAGCLLIDMGTSGPQTAKRHHGMLAKLGIGYLDAPVSGGTVGARDATLSIFVGGDNDDAARGAPVLRTMGRPHHLGPAGSGQNAKLANQIIVGVTIAAVAEGLAFAERNGIDATRFLAALEGGFAGSRVLALHGPRMAARDYSAAGAIHLHLKDLALAAEADGWERLSHARQVKSGFERLVRQGGANLDHSAYAGLYQDDGNAE